VEFAFFYQNCYNVNTLVRQRQAGIKNASKSTGCEGMNEKIVDIEELRAASPVGSGQVLQLRLKGTDMRLARITTFCPDEVGPGPVHSYLLANDEVMLVDPGIPTNMAKGLFYYWRNQPIPPEIERLEPDHGAKELLTGIRIAGFSPTDIRMIFISHGHPDHFFMTNEIVRQSGAAVCAHVLDTPDICNPWAMLATWVSRQQQMKATGMPRSKSDPKLFTAETIRGFDLGSMGITPKIAEPVVKDGPPVLDGHRLQDIELVHLPGHSPGSIGIIVGKPGGKRILLCGDVLLYPITPHPEDLLVYLQTLDKLATFEDIACVFPAHGDVIWDLHERVCFLKKHHEMRLRATYETCHSPRSVWDIASMPNYFDTYVDPRKFNFLAGLEAMVHVELLTMVGGLQRTHRDHGVHYFRASGEPFAEVYQRIKELVANGNNRSLLRY